MTDKKNKAQQPEIHEQAADTPEVMDNPDVRDGNAAEAGAEDTGDESTLAAQLDEARAALEKEKKEYLFLMADFDNYRKRVTREKAELLRNGAEKVLLGILPIVDDFERGLAAAAGGDESAEAILKGMEIIYNKLMKYLEANGVKPMESTGAPFDPEFHEAIASIPAPTEELKGHVIDTTQRGYMLNDKVLRHAKVAVGE